MKNILYTQDLLSIDCISRAKSNTIGILITFSIGVIITIVGTHITTLEYINYSLGLLGFIISIVAIGNLFAPSNELIHTSTKEKLHKVTYYFNTKDLSKIQVSLENGDINTLKKIQIETGPIQVILYTNNKSTFYISQIFKFIPYEYRPCCDAMIFEKL